MDQKNNGHISKNIRINTHTNKLNCEAKIRVGFVEKINQYANKTQVSLL